MIKIILEQRMKKERKFHEFGIKFISNYSVFAFRVDLTKEFFYCIQFPPNLNFTDFAEEQFNRKSIIENRVIKLYQEAIKKLPCHAFRLFSLHYVFVSYSTTRSCIFTACDFDENEWVVISAHYFFFVCAICFCSFFF